jgi:hypothetical protein
MVARAVLRLVGMSEIEAHLEAQLNEAEAALRRARATLAAIALTARKALAVTPNRLPAELLEEIADKAAAELEAAG